MGTINGEESSRRAPTAFVRVFRQIAAAIIAPAPSETARCAELGLRLWRFDT